MIYDSFGDDAMGKKFIAKKQKRKKHKIKFLIFALCFVMSVYTTYEYLAQRNFKISNQVLVKFLLKEQNSHIKEKTGVLEKIKKIVTNPTFLINQNYKGLVKLEQEVKKENKIKKLKTNIEEPFIYVYNSHQTEEYAPSSVAEYSVTPTVLVGSYILEERLENAGFETLVEERSIKNLLNEKKWNYNYSYNASRIYLNDVRQSYPTLKYFIDFHRDSLSYEKTTIELEGKSYAKLLFLIGLENPNYEKNLAFTEKITNLLDQKYPGLCKGIYKKGGEGVNGVYNQDNSEYTILLEVGGQDNKITEVLNSVNAFSEVFSEVISVNEG